MKGKSAHKGEEAGIHRGNNDLGSFYGVDCAPVCVSAFICVHMGYLCFLASLNSLHQHYMLPPPFPLLKGQKKTKNRQTLTSTRCTYSSQGQP